LSGDGEEATTGIPRVGGMVRSLAVREAM